MTNRSNNISYSLFILSAIVVASVIGGCSSHNVKQGDSKQITQIIKDTSSPIPDLTKPDISRYDYTDRADANEPLNIAKKLSRTAGGTWVVIAPHPLNDVKRPDRSSGQPTVQESLGRMQSLGTPVNWDTSKGYMLMVFDSKDELARIKTQPPIRTAGIFLRADSDSAMLSAFADFEHVKIDADPNLLAKRAALRASHVKNNKDDDDENDSSAGYYSQYISAFKKYIQHPDAPEFKAIGKLELADIMQRLAQYYCGAMTNDSAGIWKLKPLTDPAKISAEIARLNSSIRDSMQQYNAAGSSFESRQNPSSITQQQTDEMEAASLNVPLDEDQRTNFDSLGMLGKPAIPTIAAFLDIKHPPYMMTAIDTLNAMDDPAATQALTNFTKTITQASNTTGSRVVKSSVLFKIARILNKQSPTSGNSILAQLITDPSAPEAVKMKSRLILLKNGDLAPFQVAAVKFAPQDWLKFTIVPKSRSNDRENTQVSDDKVSLMTTTKSKDGDDWGVFISGRSGNPIDIWLAHGRNGVWSEFLFTGEQFVNTQSSWSSSYMQNSIGSCLLSVDGDNVVISPPAGDVSAKLKDAEKKMYDMKLPQAERQKAMTQYTQLQSQGSNSLGKTYKLSLKTLRLDTDHDGLTDLIEKRLGTDPAKADTDGDGIPDGQDSNPLAKKTNDVDSLMLQSVFTAMFSGDKSATPIVVVLNNKAQWQEFTRAAARVICMTKDEYQNRVSNLTGFRLLQFVDIPADSTILKSNGPLLFNENHTSAEIHFFCFNEPTGSNYNYAVRLMSGMQSTPIDDIAIFDKKDNQWSLRTIHTVKLDNAQNAMMQYIQSAQMSGMSVED